MEATGKAKFSCSETGDKNKKNQSKWGIFTKDRPLRVGTDCSGIEAPIVALQQLGVPFTHEFSSEVDEHCVATIKANFAPKIIFGDMTKRHLKDIPDIDLYVCGFPCQPFSVAGKREGVRDPRGTIFWECVKVIKHKKPSVFILENVKGLLSIEGGETFKRMIRELERIKGYLVQWRVLNTADYGIPQNRERLFITGLRNKEVDKPLFSDGEKPLRCPKLESFVDWNEKQQDPLLPSREYLYRTLAEGVLFVNLGFCRGKRSSGRKVCPTMVVKSRLWCVPLHRYATIRECLRLQGFPESFQIPVSKSQILNQIGNSISVNVLVYILSKCLATSPNYSKKRQ